ADILYYYNLLSYIAFLVEPFTSLLGLPPEASLAIISGMFLNLYAAVAFAAPLDMDAQQWTILAIFLGVCHSLVVEGVIMKKIGISNRYSYTLRILGGLFIAYTATFIPTSLYTSSISTSEFSQETYTSIYDLLASSLYNASLLTLKIILLITLLIFMMDYIKQSKYVQNSAKNVSKGFSLFAGLILGITYGAGILIKETNSLKKRDLFFITTFLMICHAIIEDTLLFVIFGADLTIIIMVRLIWGITLAYLLTEIYTRRSGFN
ncbi:MAG: Nucleoside recognition protein, partial [uncultured Sulfurovum sp.]